MSDTLDAYLSVLVGVDIADAMLISSTASATESGISDWSSVTTYAPGTQCVRGRTVYESTNTGNTNKDPVIAANLVGTPPYWTKVRPTNRWAMFDDQVGTQTVVASPLTVVVRPGPVNSGYLGNIDGDYLDVVVRDAPGGNVIYTYSATLENSDPPDYEEFFWGAFSQQTDFVASSLQMYYTMEFTITITRVGGTVACGMLSLGDRRVLGETQYGATAEPKSYAYVDTDKYGNTTIVSGKSASDMSASAELDLIDANSVNATLRETMNRSCVWIATNIPEYGALRVFGLGKGKVQFNESSRALLTLNVDGMI